MSTPVKAVQEAQRAAKANANSKTNEQKPKVTPKVQNIKKETVVNEIKSPVVENISLNEKQTKKAKDDSKNDSKVEVKRVTKKNVAIQFPHIPHRMSDIDEYINNGEIDPLSNKGVKVDYRIENLHPSVIKIGVQMNKGQLSESTPRCVAMLAAFKKVISDYETPHQKELYRDLKGLLDACSKFLDTCRPLSISMKNALQMLNINLTKLTPETSDSEAKKKLITCIDEYMNQDIYLSVEEISNFTLKKIKDNDVILTFGTSLNVKHILRKARSQHKKFRVIVVDCRPNLHAKEMFQFLLSNNVNVTYVYINAIAYVMKEVTKVIIGAHSILANGYVVAKLGTSQIALVAKAYNVPVIVCCEGFKISEKVITDSFVYNESGEGMDTFKNSDLLGSDNSDASKTKINPKVNVVNLLYDVTPPDFVSMVVTEYGIIPCNSVAAVVRRNVTKFH
ncbi:translation initiation factor eIF-2B subunit delta-like isoform X2 [Leptotrombidium deliense]|uniref:Translation initiation factor eIF2B subunit delta n=1 Tax=Leptotrombidium deliense TaxID=299467 RepID=A0A443SQJ0_9ACAR|nr:translation initiation factor eIF-2B subunit delta-like isoform X2 [Leptotrombidium deliense]